MIKRITSENGQAVILLVLAMVVLLGFTALAVDGSMVYSDRRYSQNGSDASSLAGGNAAANRLENDGIVNSNWAANHPTCDGNVASAAADAKSVAISNASLNSFAIAADAAQNGVSTECGLETISGPAVDENGNPQTPTIYSTNYMDVRTTITKDTQTAFAHFVFSGVMQNTVAAVTRVRPRQPLAFGYAIVALNPSLACNTTNNGTNFHGVGGSNEVTINGGGIFSNGCFTMSGGPDAEVNNAGVLFFGTDNSGTGFDIDSDTPPMKLLDTNQRIPLSAYDMGFTEARCNQGGNWWVNGSSMVGTLTDNRLYCVNGDIDLGAHDTLIGNNVTIYMKDGYYNVNGGATVQLTAPQPGYTGSAIVGLLIYIPPTNPVTNKDVQINGNSSSYYRGTILAPTKTIDFNGDGNITAVDAQLIGWNVKIGGSSNTVINYNNNTVTSRPTFIDLYR